MADPATAGLSRRRLLGAAAISMGVLAGCEGDAASTVTPDPDDPVLFVVTNDQTTTATAQVTLATDDGETVLDESVTVESGASREYDPGIASPGQYELTVAIEGGLTRELTIDIGAEELREGSNYRIILRDNAVQVTWAE